METDSTIKQTGTINGSFSPKNKYIEIANKALKVIDDDSLDHNEKTYISKLVLEVLFANIMERVEGHLLNKIGSTELHYHYPDGTKLS